MGLQERGPLAARWPGAGRLLEGLPPRASAARRGRPIHTGPVAPAGGAPVWRIELENTQSKWINQLQG